MINFVSVIKKLILISVAIALVTLLCDAWVKLNAKEKVFQQTKAMPYNKVGVLLGTAKELNNGHINLYYTYRIDAAVSLFNAQKIDYILVSGDNGRKEYDEATSMRDDLVARGVPANKIYLDYAGFRTLDSVVRCKEIFGQQSVTFISQPFHNERAIFIAEAKNINACGFNAKDVSQRYSTRVILREKLARVKMLIDIAVNKQPKFLGPPVVIK